MTISQDANCVYMMVSQCLITRASNTSQVLSPVHFCQSIKSRLCYDPDDCQCCYIVHVFDTLAHVDGSRELHYKYTYLHRTPFSITAYFTAFFFMNTMQCFPCEYYPITRTCSLVILLISYHNPTYHLCSLYISK